MKYNSEPRAYELLGNINQVLDNKRLVLNRKSFGSYELLIYYNKTELYHYYKTFNNLSIVICLLEFICDLLGVAYE